MRKIVTGDSVDELVLYGQCLQTISRSSSRAYVPANVRELEIHLMEQPRVPGREMNQA